MDAMRRDANGAAASSRRDQGQAVQQHMPRLDNVRGAARLALVVGAILLLGVIIMLQHAQETEYDGNMQTMRITETEQTSSPETTSPKSGFEAPTTTSPTSHAPTTTSPTSHSPTRAKSPTAQPQQPTPTRSFHNSTSYYLPFIPSMGKRVNDYPQQNFSLPKILNNSYEEPYPTCISHNLTAYPEWKNCDRPCTAAEMLQQQHWTAVIQYPHHTKSGEDTGKFIDRALRLAWGPNPPRIDLYVRTGCRGTNELHVLMQTVALFWPRFLGEILLVLDVGDDTYLSQMIDLTSPTHTVRVVYEHCPCMHGRIFNQYSYLHLNRHTDASYVVTVDSDCAFHSPVTPDFLFNNAGQLRMPVSTHFQSRYCWNYFQMPVTHVDNGPYGQSMVTQPVGVATSSLMPFFEWITERNNGTCYEHLLLNNFNRLGPQCFCWMCQLNVFLGVTDRDGKKYGVDLHHVEQRHDPYLRYLIHYPYDAFVGINGTSRKLLVHEELSLVVNEGLCRWLGDTIFPGACNFTLATTNAGTLHAKDLTFHTQVMVSYANWYMNARVSWPDIIVVIATAVRRFRDVVQTLEYS